MPVLESLAWAFHSGIRFSAFAFFACASFFQYYNTLPEYSILVLDSPLMHPFPELNSSACTSLSSIRLLCPGIPPWYQIPYLHSDKLSLEVFLNRENANGTYAETPTFIIILPGLQAKKYILHNQNTRKIIVQNWIICTYQSKADLVIIIL